MPESSDPYRKDSSMASPSAVAARPTPRLGEVVGGKYRIEAIIGQGGMGAVFRARHLLTERAVALKWMLPEVGGEEAVQRFLREARAMGRIDHGGVVGVLDVGVDEGATFLVMELLKGSSLRDMLESRERFEPVEAIGLLMPGLEGVEAAHRNGVVHRDLKPENIFVVRSSDGTIETTKVLDFGISKLRDDRLDHSPQVDLQRGGLVTRTGVTIGTPSYMSPEQVRGARDIDARTDVWSLGVILYELLTGQVPFRAESFGALLVAIATESFPPLDAVRPELPPMLVAAVHRALEKEPSVRFPDVASLALALEPFGPPGMRFRAPDVSRPTEPSLDLPPGVLGDARAAKDAGTVAARPRPAPAQPTPALTAKARPDPKLAPPTRAVPAPEGEGELEGIPPRAAIAVARTALAPRVAASQARGETPVEIPSLPPLALEEVPRRLAPSPVAASPRPRLAPRPAEPLVEASAADPTRWLKLGAALLVGVLVLAFAIRMVVATARPSPVVEAPIATPTPRPTSPSRPPPPRTPPRAPVATTSPPIAPATTPATPPTTSAPTGTTEVRTGRARPVDRTREPQVVVPSPVSVPTTTTPAETGMESTTSGRTGALTREEF